MVQAELLPLGYYIPIDILDKFAEKIKLPPIEALSFGCQLVIARIDEPFAITAKGATREEALANLRTKIRTRLKDGTELVGLEVGAPPHPWMEFAGMFENDPRLDDWVESMAEYRKQVEKDPNR